MSKYAVLKLTEYVSQILLLGVLYYVVFKTSIIAGAITLVAHVAYEVSGYIIKKENSKAAQVIMNDYLAQISSSAVGGGNC